MNDNFKHFESYRRERNKRRLEGAPQREMGDNATVLRQLEEAEVKEVREQQITREVHEFLQAATKQAAGIVAHVTETAEERLRESVSSEMAEFLRETIRRVQEFMVHVSTVGQQGIARKELEPHMQNLVGPALDGFRFAGDASTAEQHIGQDPFRTEVDGSPVTDPEDEGSDQVETGMTSLGSAFASLQGAKKPPAVPALQQWFKTLLIDEERTKEALKVLVRGGFMSKDEARAIWVDAQHTTR
ncbi:MAG: hypothetical protein U1F36_07170 [Planctomycetota bacterium]